MSRENEGLWSDHTNYQYKESWEEKQEESGGFPENIQQKREKNRGNPAEMRKTEPPDSGSGKGNRFWKQVLCVNVCPPCGGAGSELNDLCRLGEGADLGRGVLQPVDLRVAIAINNRNL